MSNRARTQRKIERAVRRGEPETVREAFAAIEVDRFFAEARREALRRIAGPIDATTHTEPEHG